MRRDHDPLLIFFTGAGGAAALYVKLQQQLSPYIRCLFYDRAGYDRSTLPPLDESLGKQVVATDSARDLQKLLKETGLQPPYLLVAHSFGGILLRTFLQQDLSNPEIVQGVLLFDTATELMLSPLFPRVPPLELHAVAKNVDVEALTHLQRDSGMSDEEWEYAITASARCERALGFEDTHRSAYELAMWRQLDKQVFGQGKLTVVQCKMVRDYQLLYDEGVRLGDGTEEERAAVRAFIEKWRAFHGQIARAQCGLGKEVKFMYFEDWGHDLPIRRPAMVVEEVRGLLLRMGFDGKRRRDVGRDETKERMDGGGKGRKKVGGEKVGLSPAMSFLG
jgi:pimeloyl-ACP methyl ester carboxylesterase